MNAFWRTLEYGARFVAIALFCAALIQGTLGACNYAMGGRIDDSFLMGIPEWSGVPAFLVGAVVLYVLSGAFKGRAEG